MEIMEMKHTSQREKERNSAKSTAKMYKRFEKFFR